MFQPIISRLNSVRRFDVPVNTKSIEVGEVETPGGGTALALQVQTTEGAQALTIEPRAQAQLLSNWSVPAPHFDRLPRALQAAELNHFFSTAPKDLTVRTIKNGGPLATARAFVSGRYEEFDSAEALEVAAETLSQHGGGEWQIAEDKAERDEMRILIVQPQEHDVSARRVGDMVKLGLSIRNSEIGTGALGVEFSAFRLACLNGLVVPEAAVSVRQRHIYINKSTFRIQLKNAIQNVGEMGLALIGQMRASHDLKLPNLNPEDGKLQRTVMGILRKHDMGTKEFVERATAALGRDEEASLFGLVQFVTGPWAKSRTTVMDRLSIERAGGALMNLADPRAAA